MPEQSRTERIITATAPSGVASVLAPAADLSLFRPETLTEYAFTVQGPSTLGEVRLQDALFAFAQKHGPVSSQAAYAIVRDFCFALTHVAAVRTGSPGTPEDEKTHFEAHRHTGDEWEGVIDGLPRAVRAALALRCDTSREMTLGEFTGLRKPQAEQDESDKSGSDTAAAEAPSRSSRRPGSRRKD